MANRSKVKDPGLILTVAMSLYAILVFAWWPTDLYWMGISLVGWLMFFGLFYWLLLGIIYFLWIEKVENERAN